MFSLSTSRGGNWNYPALLFEKLKINGKYPNPNKIDIEVVDIRIGLWKYKMNVALNFESNVDMEMNISVPE